MCKTTPLGVQEVDEGIKVTNLGDCVVEDDGSGIWLKPTRMTTTQMEVSELLLGFCHIC